MINPERISPDAVAIGERLRRLVEVDPETGCWNWTRDERYPRFAALGETHAVRVSYRLWRGPLAPGESPMRICLNRRCVNPEHLEALTRRAAFRKYGRRRPTHCKRGHPRVPSNLSRNTLYVTEDGERRKVESWICRICREDSLARRTPQPRPPQPSVRSIEEQNEREVERIVRRVCRARKRERLLVPRARLGEFGLPWIEEIRVRALPGEGWWEYVRRTREEGHGSWIEWALSRIMDDPRVRRELLQARELGDPLLIAEAARARELNAEVMSADLAAGGGRPRQAGRR